MRKKLIIAVVLAIMTAIGSIVAISLENSVNASTSRDPQYNIPSIPSWTSHNCLSRPRSIDCQTAMISALNRARAVMGKPAYSLPARFMWLTSKDQLLVLVNSDRALYGLPRVTGYNPALNAAAKRGLLADADPSATLSGWLSMASNWLAGVASPLYAYYEWMYDDGLNRDGYSSNLDCSRAHPSGCWGHRDNVLANFGTQRRIALGVASGTSPAYNAPAWTQLFEAFPTTTRLSFIPTVTALSTASGTSRGGARLGVWGFGFVGVHAVLIGGVPARIASVSPTHIVVVTPAHAAGVTHVVVETGGGKNAATKAVEYRYTSTSA
jgi:hypothetical protein